MITGIFMSVPLATKSHRVNMMGEDKWLRTQWVKVQKRDSKLKELTYFIMAIHRPVIAIEGDTISIFQEVKQTFPFSQRYALPLASKQIYCVHTLTVCASVCKRCAEMRERKRTMGNCLTTQSSMNADIRDWPLNQLVTDLRLKKYPERDLAELLTSNSSGT